MEYIKFLSRDGKHWVDVPSNLTNINEVLAQYTTENWLKDPDLSGVVGVPNQYIKVVGDTVMEMTTEEKILRDEELARLQLEAEQSENKENLR